MTRVYHLSFYLYNAQRKNTTFILSEYYEKSARVKRQAWQVR